MFQAFIFTNIIGSLVNNLFEVKIFNPFPSLTFSSSSYGRGISDSSLSPSSGDMSESLFLVVSDGASFSNLLL